MQFNVVRIKSVIPVFIKQTQFFFKHNFFVLLTDPQFPQAALQREQCSGSTSAPLSALQLCASARRGPVPHPARAAWRTVRTRTAQLCGCSRAERC